MKPKNEINAKKIAEAAGVSPSTVSIVLNNKDDEFRIAEKTREKILQTADEMGYRHVVREKRVKQRFNKKLICVFCPTNFDKGPTASFYAGFQKYMSEKQLQYETILFPFELGKLEEKASWISDEFTAGAIMLALSEKDIEFIENIKFDIPVVLFNRTAKGYCSVLTDNYEVGYKAMEHFIKRGHKSFGIVCPNYSSRALSLRTVGYWDKFQNQKFKPRDAFTVPVAYGDDDDTGGYSAMQQILQSDKRPTAVFVTSDNMVSGIIRCINERGLNIPGDLEIISYGNRIINTIVKPAISSFAPPLEDLSYNCAKILHNCIENHILTDNGKLSLEARCIFRESCPET